MGTDCTYTIRVRLTWFISKWSSQIKVISRDFESPSIRTSSRRHMRLLRSYKDSHDLRHQSVLLNKYSCMNRTYDFPKKKWNRGREKWLFRRRICLKITKIYTTANRHRKKLTAAVSLAPSASIISNKFCLSPTKINTNKNYYNKTRKTPQVMGLPRCKNLLNFFFVL